MNNLLLAYYGDDFTGSTDSLEFISRAGANALLFIEPPGPEVLANYPDLQVYGVAGVTRALSPRDMEAVLVPAFQSMKQSGAKHIHYKTCSTFDSSPFVGSIGKAIECGAAVFDNHIIPVLVAAPLLGRYCMFGNLFARMGIGSNGKIYRLDRHPSMSKHPVTPMHESDLRLHLAQQTNMPIELIDILHVDQLEDNELLKDQLEGIVMIDAVYDEQLAGIGNWINSLIQNDKPQFSVGSSGVEMALGKHWNRQSLLTNKTDWPAIHKADTMLVVSGSCSPVTKQQIAFAEKNGFKTVAIDAIKLCNDDIDLQQVVEKVVAAIHQFQYVLVHTGDKMANNLPSEKLGTALGNIVRQAVEQTKIDRIIVSGGDSSSYAARAMQIDAVTMITPVIPGAPLCKAISSNKAIDGLEVNFKGGQVGSEDYFVVMRGEK